jgi:ribosomal protein S12 methylthiotransferase accessory factor
VGGTRPRWAPDAFFARRAGGALVRGPDGEAWIDGRDAHALVRWLASVLDGQSTLDEIWVSMDAGQRRAVAGVLERLAGVGAVRGLDAGPAAPGSARVGAESPVPLLEHLAHLPSSAEAPPLLEGGGGLHEAVRRGAAEPPVPWSWRRPPGVGAMVVSVHDAADPRRDLRLHRALARRDVPWLPVRGGPGEVWIGPRTGPGPGCAACLRLRGLAARPDAWAARQVARQAASHARTCPPRHERRVGALVWDLALAWADLEAGMGCGPGLRLVVRLALPGAEPGAAWLAPVPGCPACGGPPGAGSGRELGAADLACRADAPLPFALVEQLVGERAGLVARCRSRPDAGGPPAAEALVNVPEAGGRRRRQEWGLGCADTAREARTVAALEAIERSCAAPRGRTILRAPAAELRDDAIDPALLVLHGDDQYARPGFPFAPLDPREEVEWTWAYSAARRRHVAVPADLVFYRGRRRPTGRRPLACSSSSGCAVGQGAGQAALHAVLEVLERDGLLLTWYGRRPPCRLDPDRAEDRRIPLLQAQLDARGYDVAVFDTTPPDIGIPCVWAMAVNRTDDGLKTLSGAGCHPDPERAVLRALREVSAHLGPMRALAAAAGPRAAPRLLEGGRALRRPRDHVLLYGLPEAFGRLRFLFESEPSGRSPRQHFRRRGAAVVTEPSEWAPAVQAAILGAGLDLLVADMTASDVRGLGLVAVRALVPGTLPMTFGGGLERTAGAPRLAAPPGPLLPHPLG